MRLTITGCPLGVWRTNMPLTRAVHGVHWLLTAAWLPLADHPSEGRGAAAKEANTGMTLVHQDTKNAHFDIRSTGIMNGVVTSGRLCCSSWALDGLLQLQLPARETDQDGARP